MTQIPFYGARLATLIVACLLTAPATQADSVSGQRGAALSADTVARFTRSAIDAENPSIALSGPAQCDVNVVQLSYMSIGVRNEPARLSAAMYVPENCEGPFPLLAEAHGTQTDRRRRTTEVSAGHNSVAFFAAHGYVVVVTDYLGLGQSDYPFHPYLHADSEASAIIDSLRAARATAAKARIPLSNQVMLFGYSQGGHAALAAQREIERNHRAEFQLAASAPMAGPYHLSQTFLNSWFGLTAGENNLLASELFAYTAISYSRIYESVCARDNDCFAPAYAGAVKTLFPGAQDLFAIRQQDILPPGPQLNTLRTPRFSAAFLLDENESFRKALKKNDLIDWTPTTPMMLCGSRRDGIVEFNNAYAAQASFQARGVTVPVVDVADDIPADASAMEHHTRYGAPLCFAAARAKLFDPIRRD